MRPYDLHYNTYVMAIGDVINAMVTSGLCDQVKDLAEDHIVAFPACSMNDTKAVEAICQDVCVSWISSTYQIALCPGPRLGLYNHHSEHPAIRMLVKRLEETMVSITIACSESAPSCVVLLLNHTLYITVRSVIFRPRSEAWTRLRTGYLTEILRPYSK